MNKLYHKKLLFFPIILGLIVCGCFSCTVTAHSPSNMSLSYDSTTKMLQVDITHFVSNPNTHYVNTVEVKINDVIEIDQDYTNQSGSSFTYTYVNIEAVQSDIIEVTARCNQGGSITEQLTVSSDEVTEESTDDSASPGFELLILFSSLFILILLLKKKR